MRTQKLIIRFGICLSTIVLLAFLVPTQAFAQDPTEVDTKHYKIEFENDYVRVLRITYGPNENSVMHEHPNAVVIMLTDANTEMTLPDGNKVMDLAKIGEAQWTPAGKHIPKNVGDEKMEAVLVEIKSKP
ncbi:MAG: hypothetical protein KJO52_03240 [Maribacter sp.]|nr:hypothetical protein [Maribacter sp.]